MSLLRIYHTYGNSAILFWSVNSKYLVCVLNVLLIEFALCQFYGASVTLRLVSGFTYQIAPTIDTSVSCAVLLYPLDNVTFFEVCR